MTLRFDAILFDLDGTLADTLTDIVDAANAARAALLGLAPLESEQVKPLVGYGIDHLIRGILPGRDDLLPAAAHHIKAHYQRHGTHRVAAFPGMVELVRELRHAGVKLAVLSNKPDEPAKLVTRHLFGPDTFHEVHGHREGCAVKPDPAAALAIAALLRVMPTRCAFVGDSDVDMLTAVNAGMEPIGVTWGFRDEATLIRHGATQVHHTADALRAALLP